MRKCYVNCFPVCVRKQHLLPKQTVSEKVRNISFFVGNKKVSPTMLGVRNNIQGNNVYAAMFPCLRALSRLRTGLCILVNIQSFSYFSKYRLKGQPASFSPRRAEVNCSSFLETNKIRLRKPYSTIYEQEARRTDLSHKPRTFLYKSLLHQLPES